MLKVVESDLTGLKFKISFALATSLDSVVEFSATASAAARTFPKFLSRVLSSGVVSRPVEKAERGYSILFRIVHCCNYVDVFKDVITIVNL